VSTPLPTAVETTTLLTEDELVRGHLDLVRKMVTQTTARIPSHVSRDDLLSAGMAGLAMAARHFDPARGVPFDRYAATRIRGALIDELRSFDWASRPVRTKARALAVVTETLTAKLGRTPTSEELAQAAGLTVDALGRLTGDVHRAVVLNYEAILDTGDSEIILPSADGDPEEELLTRERADCVTRAIDALPERLRVVVRGYFFEERTVTEIADELGVTQSRVSQLRSEAIELLRDGVNSQLDPTSVAPLRRSTGRVSRRQAAYRASMAGQATSTMTRAVAG
jgi:RNA polymerase sigma factor for flagellar operon FliA